MAAPAAAAGSAPGLCPGYAVICSFLERYGVLLDLPEFTFPQLEKYLSDTSSVPKLLVDLHIKLLRKIGKSVSADRWEKHLVKVCQDFNTTWAWELDKKGYKDMTVECKTGILKYLCECQFDDNVKFKTAINEEDPDKMRLQPIGRDKDGQMYWFQLDQDHNVRVYLEEQDDLDGSSWKCLVRDRNELAEILASLKTHIDPELLKKEQEEAASVKPEADGNNKTDDEDNKKTDDTTEDEEDKASKEIVSPVVSKEEDDKKLKQESEVDVSEAKSLLTDIQHSRTVSEPNTQSDKPCVDIHAKPIKEEPMEVSETTVSKAASAKESLSECASRHTEQEDVRKNNTEDLQKAMKNDHQAKIPLKKREMKLSEDFDKSSGSIIVRNPTMSQVKEPLIVEKINEENDKSARVKDLSSENVNIESMHTTDDVKSHNNGLGKTIKEGDKPNVCSDINEKHTNSLSGDECEPKENRTKASTDNVGCRVGMDDMVVINTGEQKKVPISTHEEKEKAAAQETIVEVVQEVAPLSPSLVAKPSPSLKDPIKPLEKSCDNKDVKNNESNAKCELSHAKGNTCISKETTKALVPEKRSVFDKSEEKGALKGKDSSELSEIEKSDVTKTISEPKPIETIITMDIGKPEHVTYKPDSSTQLNEMPGVIQKMGTTLSNKETPEKLHGFKDSETASVIKKTEVLKQSKGPESKDPGHFVSSKETNKSLVIMQADKTSSSKETERLDSSNDKTKLLGINKVHEQDLAEHSKKDYSPKDPHTSCIIAKKTEISGAEVITDTSCSTGKKSEISESEVITEKEEKVVFKVNSGNSARCQDKEKTSNERSGKDSSKPESEAVDVMAIKDNATQLEDHITIKELPISKATENVKEEKNTSLNPAEKEKPSNEVGQLVDTKSEAENKTKKIPDSPKEESLMPLVKSSKSEESKMDITVSAETVTGENKEPKICNETDTRNSDGETIKDHSTAICDISAKQPAKIEREALTPIIDDKSKRVSCSNVEIKSVSLVETSVKADDLNKDNDKSSTENKLEGSKASEEEEAKEHHSVKKEKNVEKCDSTDVQEKGIRLKIQVPTRRRKSEVQRDERTGDSDSETGGGRSLRRSPRISRPTAKVVEIQDRRLEKLQATVSVEEEEEEEEEKDEEDGKVVQKKPREKTIDQEGQPKKGKKRRRTRWSSTRTRCSKKGSGEDDDDEDESSEQEDSEEEDDSDEDYKVERGRKRRRNRNRERHSSDSSSDDDLPPNDDPCKQCGLPNQPELILLCDSCDNGYHTACLRPPLMIIPDGEWFCPPCQHKHLCDKLEEQLQNIDAAMKKRDRAERRKERLVYVGISVENIIAPSIGAEEEKEEEVVVKEKKELKKNKIKSKSWGRRSTRTKKSISYRFDEFDEAIEEAIEEDIKEAEGGGAGRGKDMANITGHRGKDMSTILHGEDGKENGCPPRPSLGQRRKKRRRLNDLDSESTVDEEESEDEFRLSDSTEEEEFVVSENAESEAEVEFNDSDFGSTGSGPHTARSKRPTKRRKSGQLPRKRRNRGYSDDEEDETDEEDEEEEMVTEGSSEFSDSDLDVNRRRSRRSLKKQVNYCETSESEGSKAGTNRDKMKPRRHLSSSESEASRSRGSEDEEKETRVRRRTVSPSESRKRRRLFSLKRRRASEDDDDDDDDDSDDSEEEDRPVRKRVNRIDSDDSDEEEDDKSSKAEKKDEEGILGKGPNALEYNLVELPPTNGQNSMKGLEGFINRPEPGAAIGPPGLMGPKNICVTPVGAIAPNGMATQEMVPQDDDEDDLLGVTDLVDYVCNSEQL